MIERVLGKSGLSVSALGLGCMGMSEFYDPKQMNDAESIRVIHRFLDAGGNFLDTADMYGAGAQRGPGRQGHRRPSRLRSCWPRSSATFAGPTASSSASGAIRTYVKQCCDASLKRLGVDVIDLYYQHRVDPKTPIEETVGAMAELVKAGQGAPPRFIGGVPGHHSPGRESSSHHGPANANSHSGAGSRKPRFCRLFANWAWGSSLTVRWGEDS